MTSTTTPKTSSDRTSIDSKSSGNRVPQEPLTPSIRYPTDPRTPRTPGAEGGKRVGFARPTLIIPPPQGAGGTPPFGPYSAQFAPYGTPVVVGPTPGMYGRKASTFMFNQINGIKSFTMSTAKSGMGIGEKCSYWIYNKFRSWSKKWFTHFFLTFILGLYTLGGAVMFVAIEGANEEKVVEQVIRPHRYQLIRDLRNLSIILPDKASEGEWEGAAIKLLMKYEKMAMDVNKTNSFLSSNPDGRTWTMWNSIVYCATIYTTIGYGHICPTTTTGRALTIVYSIIGIPLFLIALTDFGKLFTRGIKFVWSFVRRLYYTGNCRRYRKTAHVQEIFKGAQMMYDIATFRRPSTQIDLENPEAPMPPPPPTLGASLNTTTTTTTSATAASTPGTLSRDDTSTTTPPTPNISNYEIDDEFNLPISVALFILVSYIFIGAVIYSIWEGWKFFISFYFVFISMSTIGFGDYVPKEPICMIVSIVYLVFGLALMSMCINVVQEKLSDTFKQASAKIGMSIGLEMSESGSLITADNIEVVPIHGLNTSSVYSSAAQAPPPPPDEKTAQSPQVSNENEEDAGADGSSKKDL